MSKASITKPISGSDRAASRGGFDLSGRTAYVTGGRGLIGRAVVAALGEAGAAARALEPEGRAGAEAKKSTVPFDATDLHALDKRLGALEADHGAADIWVNCAYPRTRDWAAIRQEPFDVESWRDNVELQMNSVCALSAAVAERMAARGGGAIINVASIYGVVAPTFAIYEGTEATVPPAYSAIKGGIIAYCRYLAAYYGPRGVRVNALVPGGVANRQPAAIVAAYSARTPLGRMAAPEEIAGPAVFLASDAAAYVTGSALMVDGGWTAV